MPISTLVNAGHPYALAAVLADDFAVRPLLLTRDGKCRAADRASIFESAAIITGDLPANPFADCDAEIHDWLSRGGVLVHYTGWKDFQFLPGMRSLFAVDVASRQPMSREPVATRIREEALPRKFESLPPVHFLTRVAPPGDAEVLIETVDGAPVLVRTAIGRGCTYLFLAPISFPAGEQWAYWDRYADLIGELTSVGRGRTAMLGDAFSAYAAAHRARRGGDLPAAQRLFLDVISLARVSNITLSIEAAQMVRAVGKDTRDPVAVLLGFRTVTDLIGALPPEAETYDYSADQQPWYELRHRFDEINYLSRDPEESTRRAEACFAAMDARPPAVGALEKSYHEGLRHLLHSLIAIFDFGRNVEPRAALDRLPLIESELAAGSDKTYQNPQVQVFRAGVALLKQQIPFCFLDDGEALAGAAAEARARLRRTQVKEFGTDIEELLALADAVDDYEDDRAWQHAVRLGQPGLRALAVGILTLRARLRREPLVAAGVADYQERQRVTQIITRLQGLRNEGRAATVRLLLLEGNAFPGEGLVSLPLSLDVQHAEEIIKYAPAFELFVFDRNGQCVGALPHGNERILAAPHQFLLSSAGARLAEWTRAHGAGISIDATMRTTLFASGRPVARTVGTRWSSWDPLPLLYLRSRGDSSSAAEAVCRRVLTIVEDYFPVYHGGSVVLAKSSPLPDGKPLGGGVPLSELSDADFAALLAIDGSIWMTPDPDPRIQKVGCKLPVPQSAADEPPHIAGRGTRHRAAAAFATQTGLDVLIFSADTGATYASAEGVLPLW